MGTNVRAGRNNRDAVDYLRELFPPGATVTTLHRWSNRNGDAHAISVLACDKGEPVDVSWAAARVVSEPLHPRHGGVKVGGGGMDMGFHLVYNLSRYLWPDYPCNGSDAPLYAGGCPSPDHVNRDTRDDPPAVHHDGYALRHRWLS